MRKLLCKTKKARKIALSLEHLHKKMQIKTEVKQV